MYCVSSDLPVSIIMGSVFTFRTDPNALPTSRYWQADINGHASMGLGSGGERDIRKLYRVSGALPTYLVHGISSVAEKPPTWPASISPSAPLAYLMMQATCRHLSLPPRLPRSP